MLRYETSDTLRDVLVFSLEGLLKLGYGWKDAYAQCIIGGILDSYVLNISPELGYCDSEEKERLSASLG